MSKLTIEAAREGGFVFESPVRGWINTADSAHMASLAQDAALVTTPNAAVPVEFLAYIDPQVIEILTGVRNARKIFDEVKKGDWTVPYAKFRVQEYTGVTTPYTDYADGAVAGVNANWPSREQYVFQTTIKYGDLETDISSVAKMNLAAEKQKAAARVIDIDANRFYLYGVAGKKIYGLLNDPNLNPAITPESISGVTQWSGKTADAIYNDILKLLSSLRQNSAGNINEDTPLVLCVSPASDSQLAKINNFGLSVRQMLKNELGDKISFVTLPELYSATAGNTVLLVARDVLGVPTAQLAFGEKFRAHAPVRRTSSIEQKISATTYGAVIYQPFAIATMVGA